MQAPIFVFRVDASPAIGMGHLSRCLTLARALMDRGARALMALTDPAPAVAAKVGGIGAGLAGLPPGLDLDRDLAATLALAREKAAAGVVVDGYHFDQAYLDGLAASACCLFFDEMASFHYRTALVLNQNLYAREGDYRRDPGTRLLLGPAHAVLRPEFAQARDPGREHPETASRLLINFGGSDPADLTSRALEGLAASARRYQIKVVLGGANLHADRVRRLAQAGPHRAEVLTDIGDMQRVMNWAQMALSASGTNTTLEMCCLGLPAVLVIQVENQRLIGEAMAARGLGLQLGWWEEVSGEMMARGVDDLAGDRGRRERFSLAAMAAVDGLGADRVAQALLQAAREWRR